MDPLSLYEPERFLRKLELLVEAIYLFNGEATSFDERLIRGQNLVEKLLFHSISAYNLIQEPIRVPHQDKELKFHDIGSIIVLTRAAWEAYLMFYYVFVDFPPPSDSFEYRYSAWHLESLAFRQEPTLFPVRDTGRIKVLLEEADEIDRLRERIRRTQEFKNIPGRKAEQRKKRILENGSGWRPGWQEMAIRAGFGPRYAKRVYSYLSHYAHSSSISGWQMAQIGSLQEQKKLAEPRLAQLEVLISKAMMDLVKLFPNIENRLRDKDPVALKHVKILAGVPSSLP
jgi:hypothetical protein